MTIQDPSRQPPAPFQLPVPQSTDLLHRVFARLVGRGTLSVTFHDGRTETYGDGRWPRSAIRINTAEAERAILAAPGLKVGECYMDGTLETVEGDLHDLLYVLIDNRTRGRLPAPLRALAAAARWLPDQLNDLTRARRNVAHHYDLDGRLYDLFLDPERQYSCAYFETPEATLEEAQLAKMRRIAVKLRPVPGLRVLDIGSGWGGLGLHLAREEQMQVRGITLSREQLARSRARAGEEELADLARFDLVDYREVEERYDRIVSVGMLEHVGRRALDAYFAKVRDLLEEDGIALIHSIGSYFDPRPTNPWIAKYIFPGGYLPSLSEVMGAVEKARLLVTDVEIWRLHYAETLKEWRRRFIANHDRAVDLYDERFCRMWEFYLAGSEASLRAGVTMVFQMQLVKDRTVLPATRSYMERPAG